MSVLIVSTFIPADVVNIHPQDHGHDLTIYLPVGLVLVLMFFVALTGLYFCRKKIILSRGDAKSDKLKQTTEKEAHVSQGTIALLSSSSSN